MVGFGGRERWLHLITDPPETGLTNPGPPRRQSPCAPEELGDHSIPHIEQRPLIGLLHRPAPKSRANHPPVSRPRRVQTPPSAAAIGRSPPVDALRRRIPHSHAHCPWNGGGSSEKVSEDSRGRNGGSFFSPQVMLDLF